jgi:hypothetical protein
MPSSFFPSRKRLWALPKTFKYITQTMVFAIWSTRGIPGGSAGHENTTSNPENSSRNHWIPCKSHSEIWKVTSQPCKSFPKLSKGQLSV